MIEGLSYGCRGPHWQETQRFLIPTRSDRSDHSRLTRISLPVSRASVFIAASTRRAWAMNSRSNVHTMILDDREWEVLVPVESRHSGVLVVSDVILDLLPMGTYVRPCVGQVFRSERRVSAQQLGLAGTQPPRLLQYPDRYSGSDDARVSATDSQAALDPGRASPTSRATHCRTCAFSALVMVVRSFSTCPSALIAYLPREPSSHRDPEPRLQNLPRRRVSVNVANQDQQQSVI